MTGYNEPYQELDEEELRKAGLPSTIEHLEKLLRGFEILLDPTGEHDEMPYAGTCFD